MRRTSLVAFALSLSPVFLFALPVWTCAQTSDAQSQSLITQAVDETKLTLLKGNTHPLARPEFDRGAAPPSLPMERMLLVLTRSPEQEAALQRLLEEQQDKSSPNYHKWLTPEQFGRQFGPSDQDIQTITSWLRVHGFQVAKVAKGRTVIEFSGTAAQVQEAFHTAIHKYAVNGEEHWANASDPQIPTAITPVVAGIVSLHNFPRKPLHRITGLFARSKTTGKVKPVKPENSLFTFPGGCFPTGNCFALGPFDFATIYNVLPLWNETPAIDGTGQMIAIVAESDINLQDVTDFRNAFGMPAPNVQVIHDGPDPGIVSFTGDETESDLDVQWSGAVAKGAQIEFVVSSSTNTSLGVDLSAVYIVDNNVAPVLSESYGDCEFHIGTAGNQFYTQLWQQAAAEGITAFLSSGDSGADVCDRGNLVAMNGLSVSGFSSTPYNVSVGGTDFNDLQNPTQFWNLNNNPTTQESAKGYIPETTWNDSCTNSEISIVTGSTDAETNCNNPNFPGFLNLIGGSGGKSNCTTSDGQNVSTCSGGYPKPPWQTGPGVPNDMKRDVPDVSLFASDGFNANFYIICEVDVTGVPCSLNNGIFLGIGGTSASSPAFAGVLGMVNQKTQSRQGNANFVFYKLAAQPGKSCNSSGTVNSSCVFYDVTSGTIAMPCQTGSLNCNTMHPGDSVGVLSGFSTTPGYDLATGLGSVNVTNLVNDWSSVTFLSSVTTLSLNPTMSIPHGTPVNVNIAVSPKTGSGTPTGLVSLFASTGQGVTDFTLNNGTVSSPTSVLPGGSYTVTAHYAGDGTFGASDSAPPGVAVTVSAEPSTTTDTALTFNASFQLVPFSTGPYGSFVYLRADVAGQSGNGVATGSVNFTDNGTNISGDPYALNSEGNTATPEGLVTFSTGAHSLGANYSGDSSFNASSVTSPANFTITQAGTATSVSASPPFINFGGSTTLNVTISTNAGFNPLTGAYGGASFPTGTVTFFSGSTQIGNPVPVIGEVNPGTQTAQAIANLTTQLPLGQDSITAKYTGDVNYVASAGGPIIVSVTIPTTTTASSSSQMVLKGMNVTFTAQVTPNQNGGPGLTGTVQFQADGVNVGNAVPISNGQAQVTTNFLVLGNHVIAAIYSGDSNYGSSLAFTSVTVNPFPTTTTATPSSQTALEGTNVTFTALVMPTQNGGPAVTGTVQFQADGTNIGNAVPISNGQAQVTTNSLAVGSHTIAANYSGDSNYGASSGTTSVTVNPAFSLSAGPATVTISSPGGMGTTVITVTDQSGFNGTVNFTSASCSALPSESSCGFNPASVTGTGTTTLTFMTTAPSMLIPANRPDGFGRSTPISRLTLICILCMGILLLRFRRTQPRWSAVLGLVIFALLLASAGCGGGGGGGGFHNPGTPVGMSQVTVKATSGTLTHTTTITLNVQ